MAPAHGRETLQLLGDMAGGADPAYRDELLERFDLDPSRRMRAYSKGNRRKVALVAAFMTRPSVLLLDEPTSGLDPLMAAEFQAVTRECAAEGRTVFLSSHLLDEVEDVCKRVAILREGHLVGEPGDVVARLSDAGIRRLHGKAPSLERIFLTYDDTRATQREAVAAAHGRLEEQQAAEPGGEHR